MKLSLQILMLLIVLGSCNNNDAKRPSTSVATGTEFIRATLDGNFKSAEKLLLNDVQNTAMFDSYKTYYERLPPEKKQAYKKASYIINTLTDENDSTTIINYSNSYMKQPMNIKVVRRNDMWSVDFKYTSADSSTTY